MLKIIYNLIELEQQTETTNRDASRDLIDRIQLNLHSLSKIQLAEGRRQKLIGKSAVDSVELFTRIEIYLLVIMAVIIQVLVMYNPTSKKD